MTFKREIHLGVLYRDEIEEMILGCAGHLLFVHGGWGTELLEHRTLCANNIE